MNRKLNITNLVKITFWLALFSDLPFALGLVSFQSFNIAFIPAAIIAIKKSRLLKPDCLICYLIILYNLIIWIFINHLSNIKYLIELSSVLVIYIGIRATNYIANKNSILLYLLSSIAVGIIQLAIGFEIDIRGLPLLASEPSRYARNLLIFIVPVYLKVNEENTRINTIILIPLILGIVYLNRSASLIFLLGIVFIGLVIGNREKIEFAYKSLLLKKSYIYFFSTISIILISTYLTLKSSRIVILFSSFLENLNDSEKTIYDYLSFFGGRRLSTTYLSLKSGFFDIIPNGLGSAKNILTKENLLNSRFDLSYYQLNILKDKGSFDSGSFFSQIILDGGFIAVILSLIFTVIIIKEIQKQSIIIKTKKNNNAVNVEILLRNGVAFVGLFMLWFYSTNAIVQPWLMIAMSLSHVPEKLK